MAAVTDMSGANIVADPVGVETPGPQKRFSPRVAGQNNLSTNELANPNEEVVVMSNADEAKGRLKEAAGDLTDDKDLKREGKIDRATGATKRKVDEAAEKVKDTVKSDD
jgi:uncharacterized protein YjbJ (UPF0337 family)